MAWSAAATQKQIQEELTSKLELVLKDAKTGGCVVARENLSMIFQTVLAESAFLVPNISLVLSDSKQKWLHQACVYTKG